MSVPSSKIELIRERFPVTCSLLADGVLEDVLGGVAGDFATDRFPELLEASLARISAPGHLPDLARLELLRGGAQSAAAGLPQQVSSLTVNPSVRLALLSWKHLPGLVGAGPGAVPEKGDEHVIAWVDPSSGALKTRAAQGEDLLALKIVTEGIDPDAAAAESGVTVGAVDDVLYRAARRGILLSPPSLIRRDPDFPRGEGIDDKFFVSPVFTIQWHVTQACDLSCRHCYDRSDISAIGLDQAMGILDDLRAFCRQRNVTGHVSFTGGNPLMHPHFLDLYRAAADRGMSAAVLGNPAPRRRIEELIRIQRPAFFQVSLEGLAAHNDYIRGEGHFQRAMEFLDVLRDLGVYSMVMLTLTKDNMDQVIPLGEMLRGRTDLFTFNRLSLVGEGARLEPSSLAEYEDFLRRYIEAARDNETMGLKDNLINIIRRREGMEPFGGCAGYGCGAAFNFITILPDGTAHACRKFPSPIGNVLTQGIAGVYDSAIARRYRQGCAECGSCEIRPVCGGCLAVAQSLGLDVFAQKDPYCFIDGRGGAAPGAAGGRKR